MSNAEKFTKWHKSRMGHDIGVILGINAVTELTEENTKLREILESLVEFAFKEGLVSGYSCGLSDGQSYSSNKCSLDKDEEWQYSDAKSSLEKSK